MSLNLLSEVGRLIVFTTFHLILKTLSTIFYWIFELFRQWYFFKCYFIFLLSRSFLSFKEITYCFSYFLKFLFFFHKFFEHRNMFLFRSMSQRYFISSISRPNTFLKRHWQTILYLCSFC